ASDQRPRTDRGLRTDHERRTKAQGPLPSAERLGRARRRELNLPSARAPTDVVIASHLQEIDTIAQRPPRHPRRPGRHHPDCEVEVERLSACLQGDAAWLTAVV